jgi:hypothetical protein
MEQEYEKGKTKRDAYPKCLGILKADLFITLGYEYQRLKAAFNQRKI